MDLGRRHRDPRCRTSVQRLVLQRGSLVRQDGHWCRSTAAAVEEIQPADGAEISLEELFLQEIKGRESGWRDDLQRAFEAMKIGLAAERSVREERRIFLF